MHDDFSWIADYDAPPLDTGDETMTHVQLERPLIHERRAARREFIAGLKKEALNVLVPALPPPDVDLYIVGNGSGAEIRHGINPLAFDFGSFLPHIVRMLDATGCIAYVSTWTAARQHTLNMLEMLKDNRLSRLTFCSDPYFQRREAAIYSEFVAGLDRYPERARYLAWKNHCKVIAVSTADGSRTCTITGSANLSAQPRTEQYVLTTAPEVYRFFRDEFFETMIQRTKNRDA